MAPKPARKKPAAKKTVQASLTDVGGLPLLKKPHEKIGKTVGVVGSHWGSACPPSDKNKTFQCTVLDHSLAHRDERDDDDDDDTPQQPPYQAFQLQEMGVDGTGGNSDPFWMKYPLPFLTFWYQTYPDDLKQPQQTVHTNADGGTDADAPDAAAAEGNMFDSSSGIYKYLRYVDTTKANGRVKSHFTCTIGGGCGGSVTIFGKSTGPFFKHCRRKAKNNAAHAAVLEELNELSCRQVQMPNGEYVTVFTFEECFPHHVAFMWLVAGGLSMRLNRRPIFLEYVRGFQPRAVLPHNETVHRIAELVDEQQTVWLRGRRNVHVRSFKGLPSVGLQLDLWTDRNSGIVYSAIHASYVVDPISQAELEAEALVLVSDLLHFKAFPYTSHTATNIKDWLVAVLLSEELPLGAVSGVTPDGASDGQSGVKSIPGFTNKVDVCNLHDLQRAILYSIGLAGPKSACTNQDARDLLRCNGRVVQLSHQSREVSDGIRDFQRDHGIPAHKTLSTVRTNATRWSNQKKQVTRNNMMQPVIDAVLKKYRREHANDTAIIEKDSSDEYSDSDVPRGQYTQVRCRPPPSATLLPPLSLHSSPACILRNRTLRACATSLND
jgi:hypothetical protein